MKIALVQINTRVGDIRGNSAKILKFIEKAKECGVDLALFSEMSVVGYPPRDLLELKSLVSKSQEAVLEIAQKANGIAVVIGSVEQNQDPVGKPLYNSAFWLEGGKVRSVFRKSLLPFYDVFDETRYFEPGRTWETIDFGGEIVGVSVCEDIWTDSFLWTRPYYGVDPVSKLVGLGSRLLINISASPYSMGKYALRKKMLVKLAKDHHVTVIYVNQVGGNDELIFDGGSMVVNANEGVKVRAPFFKEGMTLVDLGSDYKPLNNNPDELDLLRNALITGLRDYVHKCGFQKVALGLSGGIDSALVAHLAVKSLGADNVMGLLLPSRYTSAQSIHDARFLAKNMKINIKKIFIEEIHKSYEKLFGRMFGKRSPDTTEENIQARIRGNLLMALSNKEGYLVLSTGNKSELAVGYCTLYGDMSGGLSVISDLPKTVVYQLARFMNKKGKPIPENIFTKAPTAELKPNQKDQDTLPPYDVLDGILKAYVEDLKSCDEILALGYDKKIVGRVLSLIQRNEYKRRQAPLGLRVTSKAFGTGRRFPIACKI